MNYGDIASIFDTTEVLMTRGDADQIRLVFFCVFFADIDALMSTGERDKQLTPIVSRIAKTSSWTRDRSKICARLHIYIKKGKPWLKLAALLGDWVLVELPTLISQTW